MCNKQQGKLYDTDTIPDGKQANARSDEQAGQEYGEGVEKITSGEQIR